MKKKKDIITPEVIGKDVLSDKLEDVNDFEYVQMDSKIHDVKFEDKPTTFLKDAIKRFAKNKSSVVAATILGILILTSIIVPLVNTNDTSVVNVSLSNLPPRWAGFDGTGFMDGTISVSDIIYDEENDAPLDYKKEFIKGDINVYDSFISNPNPLAKGGSIGLHGDRYGVKAGIRSSSSATFTIANEYNVELVLDSLTLEQKAGNFIVYFNETTADSVINIPVLDVSKEQLVSNLKSGTPFTGSLNEAIKASTETSHDDLKTGYFSIVMAPDESGDFSTILIDSFTIKNEIDAEDKSFESISIIDANDTLLKANWVNIGNSTEVIEYSTVSSLYNAVIKYCSFIYDKYAEVFGNVTKILTIIDIKNYADLGYISYTISPDKKSCTIEILNEEKCPIVELTNYKYSVIPALDLEIQEFECVISKYRELGYSSIPYFIFGTNAKGQDFFKMVFEGLRTSLLLGFACAAINILIGIVWGAISGYFGGYTDLLMERFTDILGGMPWIVVMTLCVLHLGGQGRDFFVFLLALCLTGWIGTASSMRSQMYRYKGREYVLASRTLGAKDGRLIFKHILPNAIGPIVTSGVLIIPGIIFQEATIAYLGLGLKGFQSLGVLLSDSQSSIQTTPYLIISSSIIVAIIMIAFNLFGNGLRDAFNPSLKGAE